VNAHDELVAALQLLLNAKQSDTLYMDSHWAPARAALVPVRPGAIVLARHGEPALSRKCFLTSDQYRDWWARYEVGGLLAGQTPPPGLLATAEGAGAIYASTRPRAQETAAAIAAGREIMSDALFIEAPLPPPHFPTWFKLPPKYWGAVARFWWHVFNHHEGQESRAEAEARSEAAARAQAAADLEMPRQRPNAAPPSPGT
jgi:broad specificity phosphatase PhoE